MTNCFAQSIGDKVGRYEAMVRFWGEVKKKNYLDRGGGERIIVKKKYIYIFLQEWGEVLWLSF